MADRVEADVRAAPRDLLVRVGIRIISDIGEVSDAKASGIRAC
jgi:hypothetical protein